MNNRAELDRAKQAFHKMQNHEEFLKKSLVEWEAQTAKLEKTLVASEKARSILQTVANEMQQTLEFRITNIVSMALATVFDDPYEFKMKFETRRNQTEVDFFFVRNGNEADPMECAGGGAVDIASLALRMAIWSIRKTRALMILDEPAKFLSRDLQSRCSELLKELSEELGIQMVIVSHIPELIEQADRTIEVTLVDGISKVKCI